MAHYSIVKNLWNASPAFVLVIDAGEAHYLFAPGRAVAGLNDARIARLVKLRSSEQQPTTPEEWVRVMMINVGYFGAEPLVETESLEDAKTAALALL